MLKTKAETMKVLGRTYRDRVILQQPVKIPDGQGGSKSDLQTVATVGAYLRAPRVSTDTEAGAVVSEMTYEIKIQNRPGVPDVRKGWRGIWGNKTFSVEHVYDDAYDQTKVLVCREVVR